MIKTDPAPMDGVRGDATGLSIPAHADALAAASTDFLTRAFHAFGSLSPGNRVTRIARFDDCPGGSTGQKRFLTVEYETPEPGLHTELFVKFSRDFTDPLRDRGRYELEAEVRFAALSRLPGFPIRVPIAYFADYHHDSGTGLLITQQIAFGSGGIEPHHEKCLDHELDEPIAYYRVLVKALARLAAAHKSGRLAADIAARFPYDAAAAAAADPIRHDETRLRQQVARYAEVAANHPRLLPPHLRSAGFIAQLDREVGRFVRHEAAIKRFLQGDPEFRALCHWNANIDNAWFWRDAAGERQCGLMDWGRVSQMNLAFALWGCLAAADLAIWDRHLDELLALFIRELREHGGPQLDAAELMLQLQLYAATMGLAWLLDAPARVLARTPELAGASGLRDPLFRSNERARAQLHIATVFLNFWQTRDFGAALDRLLERMSLAETP